MPIVVLNADERAALNEPNEGQGGFQTLFTRLQGTVQPNGELQLSDVDVEQINRHRRYGGGGWQARLNAIFNRTLGPLE